MSIAERWSAMQGRRNAALDRARAAAELTIPSLVPPEGHTEFSELPQPFQSLGARGVNNLSSKLLLTLMPPSVPFFRYRPAADVSASLSDEERTGADRELQRYEDALAASMEEGNLRSTVHGALLSLVVAGNTLLYTPKNGENRAFSLEKYCVARTASGRVTEMVIKEVVDPTTLDPKVRAACQCGDEHLPANDGVKTVEVFTRVVLDTASGSPKHVWSQEINALPVPDSDGNAPEATSPWMPLRWKAIAGEDYGRGHVEEYLGDLRSLDGINEAILGFAAASAKVVFLVAPNSTLDADELQNAESGDVLVGNEADVTVLQIDKFNDFQAAKAIQDGLELRISHAFLLSSGTIRNAERVTAEEVRLQAQELEDVLGGVYAVLSQELQLPLVRRIEYIQTEAGNLPKLDSDAVQPVIITGLEALGRGHELQRFRDYLSDAVTLFGDEALRYVETEAGMHRLATMYNVDVQDLLRTAAEVAEDAQSELAASLMQQAAGPVAGQLAQAPQ
ncbi:MAG: portal protein [Planctomycetota bacterium]